LLSGLISGPFEDQLVVVFGFVWRGSEEVIGASFVHEVDADQAGEGERALHGRLVGLRQSQEQIGDQGDGDLDANGVL
ncbi:hypothetical protein SAMN05880593_1731, partial [Rhizobium sp. RU36D]